jgi:hypothetical protein
MGGIFEVKELEAKRAALAAESEVYRQTLNLELQNLRLYAVRTQQKLSTISTFKPFLTMLLPFAGSFLGRPKRQAANFLSAGFLWQLARKSLPRSWNTAADPKIVRWEAGRGQITPWPAPSQSLDSF